MFDEIWDDVITDLDFDYAAYAYVSSIGIGARLLRSAPCPRLSRSTIGVTNAACRHKDCGMEHARLNVGAAVQPGGR
ncbi:hypothetical protein ACWGAN_25055 [Streptomyces sp. NPDC054945]